VRPGCWTRRPRPRSWSAPRRRWRGSSPSPPRPRRALITSETSCCWRSWAWCCASLRLGGDDGALGRGLGEGGRPGPPRPAPCRSRPLYWGLDDRGLPGELGLLADRRLPVPRPTPGRPLPGRSFACRWIAALFGAAIAAMYPAPMSSMDWICSESTVRPMVAISALDPSSYLGGQLSAAR